MANAEQLEILRQGAEVWNKWRAENRPSSINLTRADLDGAVLDGVNLSTANLIGASLLSAKLRGANLNNACFIRADLRGANLADASLVSAGLTSADLRQARLMAANLSKASLKATKLQAADLSGAVLYLARLNSADFSSAVLDGAEFAGAELEETIFGNVDLTYAKGLEHASHLYYSIINSATMHFSKGNIPLKFLRGIGLSDWEIELVKLYNPDLSNEEINNIQYKMYELRASQALQISPLFISYSHADSEFIDKLEGQLNGKGIRFWRDIHDMKAGRMEKQIDRAIRQNPTVLLVLSSNSIRSDWVEHEVRRARELEKEIERDVLCPVGLDNSWKDSRWPKRIMEQMKEYNILDFSKWKDDSKFDIEFRKLIDGLELFYKG